MPDLILLRNCKVASGGKLKHDYLVVLDQSSGKILDVQPTTKESTVTNEIDKEIDCHGHILTAGFIDLQLNGGWDVDFCTPAKDYEEKLDYVARSLTCYGVTGFCPTLITSPPDTYKAVLPHLHARRVSSGAHILGAHLEGPFLNPKKHGIHEPSWMKTTETASFRDVYGPDFTKSTAIVTIAPEMVPNLGSISELVKQGIVVSLGHSDASHTIANEALRQGATMLTHLYNAMPSLHHREPSLIDLLGGQNAPAFGLIADSIHVSRQAAALAYKLHPQGCCLITDANSPLGMPDGTYMGPHGMKLTKKGEAAVTSSGAIGGGACSIDSCFRKLKLESGAPFEKVIQTVNENPARVLGLTLNGKVEPNFWADLVLMDSEGSILKTFVRAEQVYNNVSW
jgi:N-acetylglucosamine-6-phosphate deacetylase